MTRFQFLTRAGWSLSAAFRRAFSRVAFPAMLGEVYEPLLPHPGRSLHAVASRKEILATGATLATLGVLGLAGPADARTWRITVDGLGDAPTVQAGIDSAATGDVVLVGPGRYVENVDLKGKGIHLLGEMGAEATVLDGSGAEAPVVTCVNGETNATVIEGLTITGGRGRPFGRGRIGGGVYADRASPILRHVTVSGNRVESPDRYVGSWAGGIVALAGEADPFVIEDCMIESNYAWSNAGGILAEGRSMFRRNVIRGNRTEYGDGGGIYIFQTPQSQYAQNIIVENVAGDHGGGIYVNNGGYGEVSAQSIEISDNIIIGNQALGRDMAVDCSGGGIWMVGRGASVHHNTIAFNWGESRTFPGGGGICALDIEVGATVEANVIYRNNEGGIVANGLLSGAWNLRILHNVIFSNGHQDIFNNDPGLFTLDLEENIFADPVFCVIGRESRGELAGVSPALHQPWGTIGAVTEPSCGPMIAVPVERVSWGAIKARYGS